MIKKKGAVCLVLVICLLIVMVSFISGCKTGKLAEGLVERNDKETWALIKVGGGEPLHVKVVAWQAAASGNIYIYTENRMYMTSSVNVLIVEDLE